MTPLRISDALLALVYNPHLPDSERPRVCSALVWPPETILLLPQGILLSLVVSLSITEPAQTGHVETPLEPKISSNELLRILRQEIYKRIKDVATAEDHPALNYECAPAAEEPGPGPVKINLHQSLWVTLLSQGGGGGGQATTGERQFLIHVNHHLALFALIRAIRRPPPHGYKSSTNPLHHYHIRLNEGQQQQHPNACNMVAHLNAQVAALKKAKGKNQKNKGKVKLESDAVLLARVFVEQHLPGVQGHHTFVPHQVKYSEGRWRVVHTPLGIENPLAEHVAISSWWPGPQVQCYTKQEGRFVEQLVVIAPSTSSVVTNNNNKKRTLDEAIGLAAIPNEKGGRWSMVPELGILVPAHQVEEYESQRAAAQALLNHQVKETLAMERQEQEKKRLAQRALHPSQPHPRPALWHLDEKTGEVSLVVAPSAQKKARTSLDSFIVTTKH